MYHEKGRGFTVVLNRLNDGEFFYLMAQLIPTFCDAIEKGTLAQGHSILAQVNVIKLPIGYSTNLRSLNNNATEIAGN